VVQPLGRQAPPLYSHKQSGDSRKHAQGSSLLFSQASSGADAKKASAAVFEYCKRGFLKQMRLWGLARRAKHIL